jgi:O-antigen/teichoic acid export membrane protein
MKNATETSASLGKAAKGAVIWSASSAILRDILQFSAMIVLVRLLTPQDYGRFALAQSIYVFISWMSAKSFMSHAFQVRDLTTIPWRMHLTGNIIFNLLALFASLGVAGLLLLTADFASAALPLAVLSLFFLINIPAEFVTVRLRVLHEWRKFAFLTTAGALLSSAGAIATALLGGGVWALVAAALLGSVPYAIHFFVRDRWRPDLSSRWSDYRPIFQFGLSRVAQGGLQSGRSAVENGALAAQFDLGILGFFTRSLGLANILAGRFGVEISNILLPVVSRASEGSDRFRRLSGLVLQGTVWVTVPAVMFLVVAAEDVVSLLYGPKWASVARLLPIAAIHVGFLGLFHATYTLLLANQRLDMCLRLDVGAAIGALGLIIMLIPYGLAAYLVGLAAHSALMMSIGAALLLATGGVRLATVASAFAAALFAATLASAAAVGAGLAIGQEVASVGRLLPQAALFGTVYLLVLRVVVPQQMSDLLQVVPLGAKLARLLRVEKEGLRARPHSDEERLT